MDNDLLIIGGGPAGITAAIYAARKGLDFTLVSADIGGQAAWSAQIENYTGYQLISGPELVDKFEKHLREYRIKLRQPEIVLSLEKQGGSFTARTGKGEYRGRAVIIATGKRSRELGVPGEKEFRNRGLSYCVTCDGPLFSGKAVAVIGSGNSAFDAALQMSAMAAKVYVINPEESSSADEVLQRRFSRAANGSVLQNTRVLEISGERFVQRLRLSHFGEEKFLDVGGVFVEVGLIPNSEFSGIVRKNAAGEIQVNCANETSEPGVFAAGDVTDVPDKQIIIAAGEGAKAALSASRYLLRR